MCVTGPFCPHVTKATSSTFLDLLSKYQNAGTTSEAAADTSGKHLVGSEALAECLIKKGSLSLLKKKWESCDLATSPTTRTLLRSKSYKFLPHCSASNVKLPLSKSTQTRLCHSTRQSSPHFNNGLKSTNIQSFHVSHSTSSNINTRARITVVSSPETTPVVRQSKAVICTRMESELETQTVGSERLGKKDISASPTSLHEMETNGNEIVREDLEAGRKIERFVIPLANLKMMFEMSDTALTPVQVRNSNKELRGRSSISPPSKQQLKTPPGDLSRVPDRAVSREPETSMTMEGKQSNNIKAAPTSDEPGTALSAPLDIQENISLKERMAMYQAAVSKKESGNSSGLAPEEEACTLPGGLASVKKQFESQEITASHSTVTQYHYQQRSVQEMTSASEVQVNSSIRTTEQENGPPLNKQLEAYQMETASVIEQNTHQSSRTANFVDKADVMIEDEMPKISTQMLKQQFEKSTQPSPVKSIPTKQTKTENNLQQHLVVSSSVREGRISEDASLKHVNVVAPVTVPVSANSSHCGSIEEFPPPPPELLKIPSEMTTYFSQSPEPPPSPNNPVIPKELYSKQRNLYELKRLYKHINPEMRRNLEKDFIEEISEIVTNETKVNDVVGDVQQAKYAFEHTGHSPQKCVSPEREYLEWDEILKGEVQSMRWMFETQPLDSIKDEAPDQYNCRSVSQQEMIAGGDVKYTAWMFETQAIDTLGTGSSDSTEVSIKVPELARGDVRTATWLFETQPLDSMNKIYQEEDQALAEKDITAGDVKTARYLFETQPLDILGHLDSVDETNFLHLRTEVEEIKGDVKKTTRLFETQPLYVIQDQSGQVLEIKTVSREETERGDVRTARWLFETQPLGMINKDISQVKVVRGISMAEVNQGGVNRAKWLFETQTLDSIKEQSETESSVQYKEEIQGADVRRQCWAFETRPLDSLKDNDEAEPLETKEIMGGDVQSTKHLFETVRMDVLTDRPEVGKLKPVIASEEEKGDVRHQTWVFETQALEMIGEEKEKYATIQLEKINKGGVSNYTQIFETMNLSGIDESKKIQVEGVTSGAVKSNKTLFETTPLYAVQDSAGHYHEVKTVRREEIVRGDVRTCRWMFETKPIDQFDESMEKFQIIKGISKEEIQSGDVKTAKWLFETQPLDAIKYFSNVEDESSATQQSDIVRGDVQTCRWLFETQPIDALYEKAEMKSEVDEVQRGDVKTCTWLFETQPLDTIKDNSETVITVRTVQQEDIQGRDVRMARFLFETEPLARIQGKEKEAFRRVTEIDVQSGDVSRKKWIFENQSLDLISSGSDRVLREIRTTKAEDIQKGNVLNCTWLFENHPIDAIKESCEEQDIMRTVTDVQGGDVGKGRFIFETYSLDQIRSEESSESTDLKQFNVEQIEKGDVKNYTMLFETQPLYAIKDKEGYYHEVTTVRKEEVISGDVRGTRWLFETKPLDSIKETDEVYVIKAVTQEDIQKGDVTSARWRFETQPLDEIADHEKVVVKTISDIRGGDVKSNTQLFESDLDQRYIRTVSVSEIQQGNVRTATWLFETRTIDELKGEDCEYNEIKTVGREDVQRGDVRQAIWLFEKQPLDSIQETDETNTRVIREEIPPADVKTTTWLFETTPLHQFNESSVERTEIIGKSISQTLKSLYDCNIVQSQGVLIEADEIGDVRMAKYKLLNQTSPEIQREEIVRGDLRKIMMELLANKESTERGIKVGQDEKGNVHLTTTQLLNSSTDINVEKEEIISCDIQQIINSLLNDDVSAKKGILIQESEKGDVRMTIYSLLNQSSETNIQQDEVLGGDVQTAIDNLLATSQGSKMARRAVIDDTERGNVQFYTTCIESGALDYLKLLQQSSDESFVCQDESKEIIHGDVEGAKKMLQQQQIQVERMVAESEIVPGDVHNTLITFMSEQKNDSAHVGRESIIGGDLRATLDSLSQAVNKPAVVEKEAIVPGNLSATFRSLEEARYQLKDLEKPEVVSGDVRGTLESLEKSVNTRAEVHREEVMPGDLQNTLKSLREAQSSTKEIEKATVITGDLQATMQTLLETVAERKVAPRQVSNRGNVKAMMQSLLEPQQQQQRQQHTVQYQDSSEGVQSTIKTLLQGEEQISFANDVASEGDLQVSRKFPAANKDQRKIEIVRDVKETVQTMSAEQHEQQVHMKAADSVVRSHREKLQCLSNAKEQQQQQQQQNNVFGAIKRDGKKTVNISEDCHVRVPCKQSGASSTQVIKQQTTTARASTDKYTVHRTQETSGVGNPQKVTQQVPVSRRNAKLIETPQIEVNTTADPILTQMTIVQTIQNPVTAPQHSQIATQVIQTSLSQSTQEHSIKRKQETLSMKESNTSLENYSKFIHKNPIPSMFLPGAASLERSNLPANKIDIKTHNPGKKGISQVKMDKNRSLTDLNFPLPPPPPPPALQPSDTDLPLLPLPPPPSNLDFERQMFASPQPSLTLVQNNQETHESDHLLSTIRTIDHKSTAGCLTPSHSQSELDLLPLPQTSPPPPPPPPPQLPCTGRKLLDKPIKFHPLQTSPKCEPIKPIEQRKPKVLRGLPVLKPTTQPMDETSAQPKVPEQRHHNVAQEKQVKPSQPEQPEIQPSKRPSPIPSSSHEAVIRPIPKLAQQRETPSSPVPPPPPPPVKAFVPSKRLPSPKPDKPIVTPKPYVRRFKTPLMIAEERYRKEREEMEKTNVAKVPQPITACRAVRNVSEGSVKEMPEGLVKDFTEKPSTSVISSSAVDHTVSTPYQATGKPLTCGAVPWVPPEQTGSAVEEPQIDHKPVGSVLAEHQAYSKQAAHTLDEVQISVKPKVYSAARQDVSATTTSRTISSQSTVVSASEQLQHILQSSSEAMSSNQQILNAFKDSRKDIVSGSVKPTQQQGRDQIETDKKTKIGQSGPLKTQSGPLPKFKVKTIERPKSEQMIQANKENVLAHTRQQHQTTSHAETNVQERSVKQFEQRERVAVVTQEQRNTAVHQSHLTEAQTAATEATDRKVEKTPASQTLGLSSAAQSHMKIKGVHLADQPSYSGHFKESGRIQQREKGAISKEAKTEKAQKHYVKPRKETYPMVQGEQLNAGLAHLAGRSKGLSEQVHVGKQVNWNQTMVRESQVEHKTEQRECFQAEEQVSYAREASGKSGLVPTPVKQVQQANKESVNLKLSDKGKAKPAQVEVGECYRKREELQYILFRVKEFEKENDYVDFNAVKAFLERVPEWLTHWDGRDPREVVKEKNLQIVKQELAAIKQEAIAKLIQCDDLIQKGLMSLSGVKPARETYGPSQKISRISIGSSKLDKQGKNQVSQEQIDVSKKEQWREVRVTEPRAQSPAKRMPSPSPSYITIESTARRTESPLRPSPSPPPFQKECSPPPPLARDSTPTPPLPPRRADTPTSRIRTNSTSPSPPRGKRADQLAKLKDTTAKLSQGVSQSVQSVHVHVAEKRSEIVSSPATLRRQLKVDTPVADISSKPASPVMSVTVKDRTDKFEEVKRTEENQIFVRRDVSDISQGLGFDTNEAGLATSKQSDHKPKVDLSELVHRFESPDPTTYFRKEPILITERLGSDSEDEILEKTGIVEEIPTLDVKSVRTVFESSGRTTSPVKQGKFLRDCKVPLSKSPQPGHRLNKDASRGKSVKSSAYSEGISQQVVGVEERCAVGSTVTSSRSSTCCSETFAGVDSRHAPPAYEDVISGQIFDISADDSPEELLKNFQKTWQESERVFRSLGYEISETNEIGWQSDQLQERGSLIDNPASSQGDMHGLSKDGISHGIPGSRQTHLS
uniref:Xin actin binding repeat containing 2 n=1 Tax=Callorhinchus milii TaxID=7868 RepID=A0A4W3HS46_CALMI